MPTTSLGCTFMYVEQLLDAHSCRLHGASHGFQSPRLVSQLLGPGAHRLDREEVLADGELVSIICFSDLDRKTGDGIDPRGAQELEHVASLPRQWLVVEDPQLANLTENASRSVPLGDTARFPAR